MDCGYPDPTYVERLGKFPHWVMDFDHRPGVNKRGNISAMARDVNVPFEVLKKEIAKCDVVCSNCHRHRTYARMTEVSKPA
jgi:hypothetical protein